MISYIWPIALVVCSNTLYQICAKSVPDTIHPFASLTITYTVGAIASCVLYCLTNKDANLLREYSQIGWASVALGIAIVGLEAGYLYAYKAGWQVSMAATVQSSFLAVALIIVGFLIYHEAITWNKIVGVAICLIGLAVINK